MSRSNWSFSPRRRCSQLRPSLLWIVVASAAVSGLYLFYHFVVPQLNRFDFHSNLSWYDLGAYGFGPSRGYASFEYESPVVEIIESTNGTGCDPRYTFLTPRGDSVEQHGPMILDAQGELVWMKHNWETTQDFKVQRYRGEDYLTYWEGSQIESRGFGSWYMLDSTYTVRYVINPVGDYGGDLHEFHITNNDTALMTVYDPSLADLSPIGGPEIGWILDCLIQEIDLVTGELIFEWRASEHFPINSTFEVFTGETGNERDSAFDWFHINSVDQDGQGNYIISSRHLHSVSCISRHTGEFLWTLGGKTNDFLDLSDGEATDFSWQHDARWHEDSKTLTLFDNSVHAYDDPDAASRAMVIYLDIPNREATLRADYYHPSYINSVSQGNVQVLDDSGRVLVGWGHSAAYSQFSADGLLECNVHFGASAFFDFGRVVSYRIFKGDWVGNPQTRPDAAVIGDTAYVSWNGATEVTSWRLESWVPEEAPNIRAPAVEEITVVSVFDKVSFETEVTLPAELDSPVFRFAALDRNGNVLAVTDPLQREVEGSAIDDLLNAEHWIVGTALVAGTCGLVAALARICRSPRSHRKKPWPRNEYQLVPFGRENTESA
ncbi:arylsulfotransferase family protein [Aspergillus undulatus]|uniref:arylsulfotransferase family protein n=1 Tax=Aspergillus undulatus TaxID=1810928 RepID=UPI003CCDC361